VDLVDKGVNIVFWMTLQENSSGIPVFDTFATSA